MKKIIEKINYYKKLSDVFERRKRWSGKYKLLNNRIASTLFNIEKIKDNLILDKEVNLFYKIDSDVGKQLFASGEFEKREIDFFSHRLSTMNAPVVLDIGANIGIHTIKWAKVNSAMHIYAFEPSPITYELLSKNIEINNVNTQVHTLPIAISNVSGKRSFYHTKDDAYSSLKDTKRKEVQEVFEIQTYTIDSFIQKNNFDKIDFIKIDVEGFEGEVIEGAKDTLSKLHPDLFVEIYKGTHSNVMPEKTIKSLVDMGYAAYHFIDGVLMPFITHDDKYYNYYFTFAK